MPCLKTGSPNMGGEIAPLAQALLYPYPAPAGDFYMRDGLPVEAPRGLIPTHYTAVCRCFLSARTAPLCSCGESSVPGPACRSHPAS